MADDTAVPEETQDTPQAADPATPPAPQEGHAEPEHDWQKRYEDLRPEYDRTTQELSTYRDVIQGLSSEDPEVQQWAMDALGLEPAEQEAAQQAVAEEDPNGALLQRVADMEAYLNQTQEERQQADQQNQEVEYMQTALQEASQALGRDFTDKELHFIVPHAVANRDENGWPGINSALDSWAEVMQAQEQARQSQWAGTKRSSVPASGQEAVEQPNLDKPADRQAWMVSQLEANQ